MRLKVVVIFERRGTAGKGGTIRRIAEKTNPRVVRTVALGTPTERERTQWYLERYVAHLPAGGEMILFDRSWYDRTGVEHAWGSAPRTSTRSSCGPACHQFERDLPHAGIILIKYWLSVSDEEQERRFKARLKDPAKQWKLSGMDLEARRRWVDYAEAKDDMFAYTDTRASPWYVVEADDKAHVTAEPDQPSAEPHPLQGHQDEEDQAPAPPGPGVRPSPKGDQNYVPERYRVG